MVVMLVSVVGGVFIVFALMALCYRSVVVHRNLSLCLRLVEFIMDPLLFIYISRLFGFIIILRPPFSCSLRALIKIRFILAARLLCFLV